MSENIFSRSEILIGKENQEKLKNSHIAVFGLGGVGGYALEGLARSGVENFTIIDFDSVSKSNINRQITALINTVGKKKTDVCEQRLKEINNNIKVCKINKFYCKEINNEIFNKKIDFVVDAIDTIRYKVDLIKYCYDNNIKIISSFGAGNRLDPTKVKLNDISKIETYNCKFLKNITKQLKKHGIDRNIPVVYSCEKPIKVKKYENSKIIYKNSKDELIETKKINCGSSVNVVAVCGYYISGYVENNIINK